MSNGKPGGFNSKNGLKKEREWLKNESVIRSATAIYRFVLFFNDIFSAVLKSFRLLKVTYCALHGKGFSKATAAICSFRTGCR